MPGIVNTLHIRYAAGYTDAVNAASVTAYGRKEGFLVLGAVSSEEEAQRIALSVLALQAFPKQTTTLGIEPTGVDDAPYVDFNVGDYVSAPNGTGGSASQRVVSLTVVEDDNGEATFAPELNAPWEIDAALLNQHLKRLVNGALRGSTATASPTVVPPPNGQKGLSDDYLLGMLRRRGATGATMQGGAGTSGGTFDPDVDQLLRYEFLYVTTCGAGGVVVVPLPFGGFPTGLLGAVVCLAQPVTQAGIPIWQPAGSDNTQLDIRTITLAATDYPNGDDIAFGISVSGW